MKFEEFRSIYDDTDVDCGRIDEDVLCLWLTWLVERHNFPSSTLTTYLSGLRRAVVEERLKGDVNVFLSTRVQDILRGVARTHVKGSSEGEASRSISSPFTIDNYTSLYLHFLSTTRGMKKEYDDILTLAVMGMGLGGALRPGEYLITNDTQRQEAILTFAAVSLNVHFPPGTRVQSLPSLDFVGLFRADYRGKRFVVDSITVHLKCSKTDQTRMGSYVAIDDPYCISNILEYLMVCGPTPIPPHSPFFIRRGGLALTALQASNNMRGLLRYCEFPLPADYSLKSLRSGAVQTLVDNNAGEMAIAAAGRWTSGQTPRQHYIRTAPIAALPVYVPSIPNGISHTPLVPVVTSPPPLSNSSAPVVPHRPPHTN